jgi:3-oxoacyl-[acyl-carrier protein] reductase
VATRFSAAYRLPSDAALLPGEVAEALVTLVREPDRHGNTLFLEPGRAVPADDPDPVLTGDPSPKGARSSDGVTQAIRSVLRVPSTHDLSGGGLGLTPGWDSLKHIEIILAVEARTGLHFKSTEIEATHQFDDLVALCTRKMQDSPPSR